MKKIRAFISDLCKKSKFIRIIARKCLYIYEKIKYSKYYFKYKTNDKVILFEAFNGRNYTCSPKAMKELLRWMNSKIIKWFEHLLILKNMKYRHLRI